MDSSPSRAERSAPKPSKFQMLGPHSPARRFLRISRSRLAWKTSVDTLLKCGSTLATRFPTFRTSNFKRLVRSIRSDESASPFLLDHVEQFGPVCVLADRETRPHLPSEAMTIARLERNAKTAFAVYETLRCRNPNPSVRIRAGVLWNLSISIQGLSTLESLRGSESLRILPSVLPATSLHDTSCGFHRFEPVVGTMLPPSRAMLLTRQGISLGRIFRDRAECNHLGEQRVPFTLLLHVAMQMGLYLHRRVQVSSSVFGV